MSPGDSTEASRALARLLRQRLEMGTTELFLESMSREQILRLAERIRSGQAVPVGGPGGSAAGDEAGKQSGAGKKSEEGTESEDGRESEGGDDLSEAERAVRTGNAGEETIRTFDYDTLRTVALECRRCGLAEERKQVVFSDGSRTARLMVVGEAPGAREDATGLPFVGPAGKLLDLLLATVGLSREESVYICNVIKCRPPGNRNPLSGEIEACAPYLRRQIELVSPRAILAVGTFAGRLLTGRDSTLGNLRGDVYSYEGVPLLVTYHPAALLRNRRWVRSTWDDLQMLRGVLDGSA